MSGGFGEDFARRLMQNTEKINSKRSNLVRSHNRRNLWVLLGTASLAVFTYGMSLYSISSERHLDSSFDRLPEYNHGKQ
ncbi:hypothetical protein D915_010092 [Fasciola hepatica]|uniref:Cytochrome c oxidase assembly factor 3 mitochondrial coiled-coil domain-containing protein n=1 Tax=Fasciola hepatica TaxID=6192 RepID=A0A4E0QYM6_FASHE|nr:hypothetical protein D915_010092 [Fasciola hepatica]